MNAALSGFSLGFSLILAIGAQNAFVLRQGLHRQHVFWVCAVCALSDAILILAGVEGLNTVIAGVPWLAPVLRYGGAAFLTWYGLRSWKAAWQGTGALTAAEAADRPLLPTLLTCLALTWLNPHVYLDTLLLIGSISTRFPGQTAQFALGAMLSSLIFFFSLGYGAALLRPVFAKPVSWRVLDVLIGIVMGSIAVRLVLGG